MNQLSNQKFQKGQRSPILWAERASQTLMQAYTPSMLPPAERWHYHQGVFLYGVYRLWEHIGTEAYFTYFKEYVDNLMDSNGNFYFKRDELDAMQAGLLLFPLYKRTSDHKYAIAAKKLRNLLNTLNKTEEGGFWHKDKYPYQMWLDGLYMAGPFSVIYGNQFHEPELFDLVLLQEKLMRIHMKDSETGLYYHGWDEKRAMPWADAETGCSPDIWGRSLGWYVMALVDILEALPAKHPRRGELIEVLQALADRLIHYQDQASGLWYQVVDKGAKPDNWLETSGSCLFIYSLAKGINLGYLDARYKASVNNGFDGLVEHKIEWSESKGLQLTDICVGTSCGTYDYYVNREKSTNDLHGVGTFIMACVEVEKLQNHS